MEEEPSKSIINELLLICPNCKQSIPHFSLLPLTNRMDLSIKCNCKEQPSRISLKDFIAQLVEHQASNSRDTNLSLLTSQLKCFKHNQPFALYCEWCSMNICAECLQSHKDHHMLPLGSSVIDMAAIVEIINRNYQNSKDLIVRIDREIERLMMLRRDIDHTLTVNAGINEDLRILCQCLNNTQRTCQGYPSYALHRLNEDIMIDDTQLLHRDKIDEKHRELKDFLQKHFIIMNYVLKRCQATLRSLDLHVHCIIQLSDSRLASGGDSIKLWDLTRNECTSTLIGHRRIVKSLVELNNGLLASGSFDMTIKLWNLNNGRCTYTINNKKEVITLLLQLNDGQLASCGNTIGFKVWNIKSKRLKATLPSGFANCLLQLVDSRVVSASQVVQFWDLTTLQCLYTINETCVRFLVQLKNGKLAALRAYNVLKLWDVVTYQCITMITMNSNLMIELKDGRLALITQEKGIAIANQPIFKAEMKFEGHLFIPNCLIELNDGRLATSANDNCIKLWKFM